MNRFCRWTGLLLAMAVAGCSKPETPESDGLPRVYTTFYPTTYFARRIGGDCVEVVCPLPAQADPIVWRPPPATIEAYQQADLIVINGAGFEKWVETVILPPSRVVDTAEPLAEQLLKYEGAITHSHGPAGQHSHEGVDGHTWLDPIHAKVQADEIRKALALLLPEHAEKFQADYRKLAADLDTLDQSLTELSDILKDQHLLASHPAYNYLAKRYGWELTSLDLDPAAMPDDETLAEIRGTLESKPAGVILWESPPQRQIAERLKDEFGLVSVTFSPCESLDRAAIAGGEDYLTVMNENIANLRDAIEK